MIEGTSSFKGLVVDLSVGGGVVLSWVLGFISEQQSEFSLWEWVWLRANGLEDKIELVNSVLLESKRRRKRKRKRE